MKLVVRTIHTVLSVALATISVLVHAQPIEAQLDCRSTAHDFIAPLQQNDLLETKPMRIEPNYVNAFKPTKGTALTAYGFKVFAVVGYQKDDPIFKPGKDKPIADSAYGVVVIGSDDAVQEKVSAAGSDADVHHVAPFITAIFCKR
jgi:hypothetical protein